MGSAGWICALVVGKKRHLDPSVPSRNPTEQAQPPRHLSCLLLCPAGVGAGGDALQAGCFSPGPRRDGTLSSPGLTIPNLLSHQPKEHPPPGFGHCSPSSGQAPPSGHRGGSPTASPLRCRESQRQEGAGGHWFPPCAGIRRNNLYSSHFLTHGTPANQSGIEVPRTLPSFMARMQKGMRKLSKKACDD